MALNSSIQQQGQQIESAIRDTDRQEIGFIITHSSFCSNKDMYGGCS